MTNEMDNLEEGTDEVDTPESPQALLAGKFKTQEDLIKGTEELYKKLESKLGSLGNQAAPSLNEEQLKAAGFMTRADFEQQQALSTFLSANPHAKAKLPALQALQGSEAYKDKTLDEIYGEVFAGESAPSEKNRIVREVIVGEQPRDYKPITQLTQQEVDGLSDEEFAKHFERDGQAPSLIKKS
jgi:hypothetical protein